MKAFAAILFLAVAGPGFLMLGIQNLRSGLWRDGVPAIELAVHRAAGTTPPPRNTWDRCFARINASAMVLFGAFFTCCLLAVLVSTLTSE
jgi:hypothetical protein